MSNQPPVEFKNVSKWFWQGRQGDRLSILEGLSLQIGHGEPGEIVVLLGPSGCGKTTILNLISGFLEPDSGEVRIFGKTLIGPNPHSATVPQAYTCFPWLSTLANVEFGLSLRKVS